MSAHHRWTADEDSLLLSIAGRVPWHEASRRLGVSKQQYFRRWDYLRKLRGGTNDAAPQPSEPAAAPRETLSIDDSGGDTKAITSVSNTVRTLTDALRVADVDLAEWEVERHVINKWDSARATKKDAWDAIELWQVKVWLRRKASQQAGCESFLAEIRKAAPSPVKIVRPKLAKGTPRRVLEISIMDPHFAMQCYRPGSDNTWSIPQCYGAFLHCRDRLLELAKPYGPFEEIVSPIGNDFLHADGVFHQTTAGTPQPEAVAWLHGYDEAIKLMLAYVEGLRKVAPTHLYVIPGNHDRQSAYTLGKTLWAWYHAHKDVTIEHAADPYKFWGWGCNLIGWEHGHSVSAAALAALMANETRLTHWKNARYCEWHLGDQHRKASSKPSVFEEQGVSVEYLPGLTPANEWHRIKGFNWAKRGAMAFVYDYNRGPVARLQVNYDNYADSFMGERAA